jgi:hypothetical protein
MGLPKGFTSISATQFKFEKKGDSLTGRFLRSGQMDMQGKPCKTFTFDCGDDGIFRILGGARLDEDLADVKAGDVVLIEFTGQTKSKSNRPVNQFNIGIAEGSEAGSVVLGVKKEK